MWLFKNHITMHALMLKMGPVIIEHMFVHCISSFEFQLTNFTRQ